MSAYNGTFSLVRFKILGGERSYDLGRLIPLLAQYKAGPLKLTGVTRELQAAWVAPESVEGETNNGHWDLSHCRAGEGFLLRVRVEKRRVPSTLSRLIFKERLRAATQKQGAKLLGKVEKKALLEEVKIELLMLTLPQVRFLDAFWHEGRGELWIYHGGKSTIDLVHDLFHKTFTDPLELKLVPMTPPLSGLSEDDWAMSDSARTKRIMRTLPQGLQTAETTAVLQAAETPAT